MEIRAQVEVPALEEGKRRGGAQQRGLDFCLRISFFFFFFRIMNPRLFAKSGGTEGEGPQEMKF